jgi:hypothetical protein
LPIEAEVDLADIGEQRNRPVRPSDEFASDVVHHFTFAGSGVKATCSLEIVWGFDGLPSAKAPVSAKRVIVVTPVSRGWTITRLVNRSRRSTMP